ncbi:MAG: ester cyclase [Leisingera sp.]
MPAQSSKVEILQSWYALAWSQGDLSAIDDYFLPGVSASGVVPSLKLSRNDFEAFVTSLRSRLRGIRITVTHAVEQGDWLAARIAFESACAATGNPVSTSGHVMIRFEDGKMAETHNQFDYITLFEQLGQLPQDTVAACLTGQGLMWR